MLKLNKYYEHVSFIHSKITGKTPPRLTYTEENKLKLLFKKIDKSFIKFCPKDRSNFFNYNYLLHKLFKILHMEQYLEYFPLLKSEEKLTKQEKDYNDAKAVAKHLGIEIKRVDFNWSNLIFSIRRTESPPIIESKKTSDISVKP